MYLWSFYFFFLFRCWFCLFFIFCIYIILEYRWKLKMFFLVFFIVIKSKFIVYVVFKLLYNLINLSIWNFYNKLMYLFCCFICDKWDVVVWFVVVVVIIFVIIICFFDVEDGLNFYWKRIMYLINMWERRIYLY